MRKISRKTVFILSLAVYSFGYLSALAEEQSSALVEPILTKAVMCESIEKFVPTNDAVAFSIDLGQVFCFTEFDPVPEKYVIYHKWYRRGMLISVKSLTLKPPRWSSFSSMQLRGTDKGPWQVDITDKNGTVYQTLRFSITE